MLITARQINTKARPQLAAIMKKKHKKDISLLFHLLQGEVGKNYVDTMIVLEETLKTGSWSDYRLIKDNAIYGDEKEEIEIFRLPQKAMFALIKFFTPEEDLEPEKNNKPTYNPKSQYVVNREKVGRPRRVLSDEEQANIQKLRDKGMSINAISKELGINNRRVMEYCKK